MDQTMSVLHKWKSPSEVLSPIVRRDHGSSSIVQETMTFCEVHFPDGNSESKGPTIARLAI